MPSRSLHVARRAATLALAACCVGSEVEAHEPPVSTGVSIAPDGSAVVRTTRGLLVGDVATGRFRLQCLELSGVLPQESVALLAEDRGFVVGSVAGLLGFDAEGCGRVAVAAFADRPIADLAATADGRTWVATNGAGQPNDAYWSDDRASWTPLGLALDGVFLSSFRPVDGGYVAAGVRVEPPSGAVHFVRFYRDPDAFVEIPVPVGDSGFEVRVLDVADAAEGAPRALVILDRYADASEPDELYRFDGSALELVHEAYVIADARRAADGTVWVAHAAGLDQVSSPTGTVTRHLAGRRVAGLALWHGRVFVTGEYGHNGFALAELVDGEPVTIADFDALEGPVECPAAPGVCDVDWADYSEEIAAGFDGEVPADVGADAGADADADTDTDPDASGAPDAAVPDAPDTAGAADATADASAPSEASPEPGARRSGCSAANRPGALPWGVVALALTLRSRRRASAG